MGYYSDFSLYFKKNPAPITEKEKNSILMEIHEALEITPEIENHSDGKLELFINDVKWYDFAEDLEGIMKNHPEFSLHVTRDGEEQNDIEKLFWKRGSEEWLNCSDIVIPRPDPEKEYIHVAVLDSKDSSASIVAVPLDEISRGRDVEDWLYEKFPKFDSNCTWETISTFRFQGITYLEQ